MNFLPIFESIFDIVFGFNGGDLGIVWTSTTGDAWTISTDCTGTGVGVDTTGTLSILDCMVTGVGVETTGTTSILLSDAVPSEW